MSKVFITRQPIFNRCMATFGYELVYQDVAGLSLGISDDKICAELMDSVLYDSFYDLIDNKHGFINFSESMIVQQIPKMLPSEHLVVEIMETVTITEDVVSACKALSDSGYVLALQNFWLGEQEQIYEPILDYVDLIKVPFANQTTQEQMQLLDRYRNKVMMLAENVHTLEDHQTASRMGYHLFQGFFFKESIVTEGDEIGSISNSIMIMINELSVKEPNFGNIARIVESDVDLSYKLLRMANSVYYGALLEITSIEHALVHIGTEELFRWCHLMLIKGVRNAKNAELIKASLVRGKLLGLISFKVSRAQHELDYFITGLFSSIDVLLGESINTIVKRLPLSDQVKSALVGQHNELRVWLNAVIDFEASKWDKLDILLKSMGIQKNEFMLLYTQAVKWCNDISNMI